MAQHEYSSAPPEGEDAEEAPVLYEFKLDGVAYTCVLPVTGKGMLEWSKLAAGAADNEANLRTAAGAAFIYRFFTLFLGDDYPRFEAHLGRSDTPPEVLLQIMQDLDTAFEDATEAATGRPTPRPTPSQPGPGVREDRILQVLSLAGAEADGDVELMPAPPPQGGPPAKAGSRPARRGGRRRSA